MCVGVDRNKNHIHILLPLKIDPTVTMMQMGKKQDVTYSDVGGCKEKIEKLRKVVKTPFFYVIQPSSYILIKEIPIYSISFEAGEIRASWH
jgi:ATP-dependent 26S proteasome regulatory subunit